MAESGEETERKITITVKTPKEKQEIEVDGDVSVKEFKELVSKKFNAPEEQLCLIFAGKILKDADALQQHGIHDGLTVHLVIKSANRASLGTNSGVSGATTTSSATATGASTTRTGSTTSSPGANIGATPFGLGGLGGLAGLGNLGMGSANFMEMQQRMQRELVQNPEMFRSMMENPFVQQMMSNPEIMRRLITSNPQMRELMERNPEITHMLNNPELMRQTLELARNPAMLQELMRTQDRAMSNLESIPGGFNALQRMYRDIQEPMMNAAQEGFGSNPFASLVSNAGINQNNEQVGRENNDPLPNPWAPRPSGGSGATTGGDGGSTQTDSTSGDSSTPLTGGTFGMFNTPGMQSLLTQMTQNPQLIQNMLQAPYIQTMMQTMSANPDMAQQILGSNPLFAANPQFQDTFYQYLPTMMNQMQNPQMQTLLSNPRALEAVMQIQQALQQLQNEAPGLFPGITGLSIPSTTTTSSTTTSTTAAAAGADTDSSTTATTTTVSSDGAAGNTDKTDTAGENATTTAGTTTTTTATSTAPARSTTATAGGAANPLGAPNADAFSNLMAQMVQMMASGQMGANPMAGIPLAGGPMAGGQTGQPPEQRFGPQLEQLAAMGFVDREANIRALTATQGDVNAAIDRLLQQR